MDRVQRVTALIYEIASASGEQSNGIQQVNQAVTQIDQITQQNAALVEQSAAKSLQDQAEALLRTVAIFELTDARGGARRVYNGSEGNTALELNGEGLADWVSPETQVRGP